MNRFSYLILTLLLVSSLFVITVRHENRLAFVQLQNLDKQRNQLQAEWGRLMLEKETWAMEHNIAEDAGTRLGMVTPLPEQIVTVQLEQ